MSIVSRKPVTVEKLASDLEAARSLAEQRIADARADLEASRASVIEQGRQRAAELRRLEAEARTEAEAAESLVASA